MKTFQINDKYSISQLDDRNWVVRRKKVPKVPKVAKHSKTSPDRKEHASSAVWGYFPTLQEAKEALAELAGLESEDFAELERWIKEIKKV